MEKYFGIYSSFEDVQAAIDNGELLKPYVALVDSDLDYNTLAPTPNYPADNEIWYYGDEQITMYEWCSDYGHITAHTFADGKGVITFDADLTTFSDDSSAGIFTNWGSPGYNCSMTDIIMPDSITIYNSWSWANTPNLVNLTIGASATYIGEFAFNGDPEPHTVTNLTCRATVPPTLAIFDTAHLSNLEHIYVPADSVNAYKAASAWSDFASIIEAIQ